MARMMHVHPAALTYSSLLLCLLASAACGAHSKCPSPSSAADARARWEHELDAKHVLALDPARPAAIKRDVHNFTIAADAADLARAVHEVMRDPARRFGLIRVDRKQANVGREFTLGERFQGRYQIDDAIARELHGWARRVFGDITDDRGVQELLCNIENQTTSDYGEIAVLELDPGPSGERVLAYRYLEGTPIAGSSTFIVTQLSPGVSRLTQIFEYQELSTLSVSFFASGGLKLHNQVVYSQASQAADLLGVAILSSDIPAAYRTP